VLFLDEFTEFRLAAGGWRNTSPSPSPDWALLRALIDVGDPGQARMRFLG
jgi:hypothetical protein